MANCLQTMKIFRRILLILICILLFAAAIGLLLPRKIHVERSVLINAPRNNIFTRINSLETWKQWSPLLQLDTSMKLIFSGPTSGVGATCKWQSTNKNIGTGGVTVISSEPFDSIRVIMDFGNHGASGCIFKLSESGSKTRVSWSLESDLGINPISRWIGLFSEQLIGPDLEKGLSNLDLLVMNSKNVDGFEILNFEVPERILISVRDTASTATITGKLSKMYHKLTLFLNSSNLPPAGPPIAVFHSYSKQGFDIEACIPVASTVVVPEGIFCTINKEMHTIMMSYIGPYRRISTAYNAMQKYIEENSVRISGPVWEEYLTRPSLEADTSRWQTNIYFPVE